VWNPITICSRSIYRINLLADRVERTGDVPNTVFPCGLLHDEASDEIRLYYGAADSSICLATARLQDLLDAVLAAPGAT